MFGPTVMVPLLEMLPAVSSDGPTAAVVNWTSSQKTDPPPLPELVWVVTIASAVAVPEGATAVVRKWFHPWLPTLPAKGPAVALEEVSTLIELGAE